MYVAKESIIESVDYFKRTEKIASRSMHLGIFFVLKYLGVNTKRELGYKKENNELIKEDILRALYLIGGMFDYYNEEDKGKCSVMFPFAFQEKINTDKAFYNKGTPFNKLTGRIADTIDNSLTDEYINAKGNLLKFKYNYLETIKSYLINRISLVSFSSWICRTINFDIKEDLSEQEFTTICVNKVIDLFKLSQDEIKALFVNDTHSKVIKFSEIRLEASSIRENFIFSQQFLPEIITKQTPAIDYISMNINEIERIINMSKTNLDINEIIELLETFKQVVFYGVPGIGKSKIIKDLESKKTFQKVWLTQFNANTGYEDFIGGETIEHNNVITKPGIFLQACVEAKENNEEKFLFVIDEINRGDIAAIFGETILALDREYSVKLSKKYFINENDREGLDVLQIPSNLYIIATMNNNDRSITNFDLALRRRFAFVKLLPDEEFVMNTITHDYFSNIGVILSEINDLLKEVNENDELLLGQSYFINKNAKENKFHWNSREFRLNFNYFILPTLMEYTYPRKDKLIKIIGEELIEGMNDDSQFNDALEKKYDKLVKRSYAAE